MTFLKLVIRKNMYFWKNFFSSFYFFDQNQIQPLILWQKIKVNYLMISNKKNNF
jgi:hypothetical protein